MDFLNRAYNSAKEQAAKAAAQAEVIAEQAQAAARQAAEQASRAAEQAQSAARLQAEEASKKLQSMQTDMKSLNLDATSIKVWAGMGSAKTPEEERLEYGITPEYLEHVGSFNYMMFMDFPEERLEITRNLSPQQMPKTLRLGPWQERHAILLTQALPAFNDLRAVLTPKKMPEERFWEIYFTLCRDKLPKEAMQFHLLNSSGSASGSNEPPVCYSPGGAMGFSLGDEEEEDADVVARAESADGWGDDGDSAAWGGWGQGANLGAAAGEGVEAGSSSAAAYKEQGLEPHQGSPEVLALDAEQNDEEPSEDLSVHDSEDLLDDEGEADDDFDAYVEGMLAASDEDGEDVDAEDDFDAYLDGLANESGADDEDNLDEDEIGDLEDLLGEEEEEDS